MTEITLPHAFEPRGYQKPSWVAFDSGIKRMVLVWHRRAGKDKNCMNLMARATQERVGTYFYFLPSFAQARRVIWDGMDGAGFRFINHIPRELWAGDPNNTQMKIQLKNGSVFQLVGSDNIDHVVGTNPVGCVFSEYSLQDPSGWEFIRPILRENGGWAIFNGTPRGKQNHLYELVEQNRSNKDWYIEVRGVDDTGVMTAEEIQSEIDAGMDAELAQQEFYCSFDGGMSGAYYVPQMQAIDGNNQITDVPFDPMMEVNTAWDLGVGDATSIVFYQQSPAGQIRIIDHYTSSGEGLNYYISILFEKSRELGYVYGDHLAPWDIQVRELGTGKSRLEIARTMGINFRVARKLPLDEGINAVRMMLPMCWFDANKTKHLRDALMSYSKAWDAKNRCWKDKPRHDWSSHDADAMRTLAVGRKNAKLPEKSDRYARKQFKRTGWMAA